MKKSRESMSLCIWHTESVLMNFGYIRRNKSEWEEVEFYACWYGEEGHDRNTELDLIIDLKTFEPADKFGFKEQQYILIK